MAENEWEARTENSIKKLQAQINALQVALQRVLRIQTHPSALAVIKSQLGDLLGTTNQVIVTNGDDCVNKKDDVTISLPQDIHTGATPEFAGLLLKGAVNIHGNYTLKWWNNTGTTQYSYELANGTGMVIASVGVPFQLQYGALGSKVALSLTTTGDVVWNYEAADADFSVNKNTAGVAYNYNAGTDIHTFSGDVVIGDKLTLTLSTYANNAAAVAGGLTAGDLYRTGGDPDLVCVVH